MTDIDHEAAERIARDLGKSYQWPGDDAVLAEAWAEWSLRMQPESEPENEARHDDMG